MNSVFPTCLRTTTSLRIRRHVRQRKFLIVILYGKATQSCRSHLGGEVQPRHLLRNRAHTTQQIPSKIPSIPRVSNRELLSSTIFYAQL